MNALRCEWVEATVVEAVCRLVAVAGGAGAWCVDQVRGLGMCAC